MRLRPELLPVDIWTGNPLAPIDAHWVAISDNLTTHPGQTMPTQRFIVYAFSADGEPLEFLQCETLDAAIGDAHAIFGIEADEWSVFDIELRPDWERVPPPL